MSEVFESAQIAQIARRFNFMIDVLTEVGADPETPVHVKRVAAELLRSHRGQQAISRACLKLYRLRENERSR